MRRRAKIGSKWQKPNKYAGEKAKKWAKKLAAAPKSGGEAPPPTLLVHAMKTIRLFMLSFMLSRSYRPVKSLARLLSRGPAVGLVSSPRWGGVQTKMPI